MPRAWSHANPVDIVGDADGARYGAAVDALADDRGVGAVLVMNVPTALTSPVEVARAVAGAPRRQGGAADRLLDRRPGRAGRRARCCTRPASRPTTRRCAPCAASCTWCSIAAASARSSARRPRCPRPRSDTQLVRAIVHGALAEKREILTEPEAKRVLAAYGIPVVPTEVVLDAAEAAAAATRHRLSRRAESPVARDHPQERCRRRRARPRLGAGGRRRRAQP